jgi:aryl-alcohol dehydrogenase-like predicted oxidoreductase
MKHRRLGATGLSVSVVGLGTWQYGGEWGREFSQNEVDEIVDAARQAEITLLDTAECYGDHLSERLVGKAIRADRDNWVVATKFGHGYKGRFERDERWQPAEVERQLEDSLRALATDRIDLYQFHSGANSVFDSEELWTMLRRQVEAGKVRALGISVSSAPETHLHQAGRARALGAGAMQVVYNRLKQDAEKELFPLCRREDLGVIARVPLASGFLGGRYRGEVHFDPTDIRSRRSPQDLKETLAMVETIRAKEVPPGVPMSLWALAWCLSHPAVTCVIPGAKSAQQVRLNAAAADLSWRR